MNPNGHHDMTNYIDNLLRQIASLRHDNPNNPDIWAACDTVEELLWQAKYKGGISPSTVYRAISKTGLHLGNEAPSRPDRSV
jgi:hypothetical protein